MICLASPQKHKLKLGDQTRHATCIQFHAADRFPHLRPQQFDDNGRARPNHLDMGRRMVVRVDDEP
jgi:hypothetical protein